MNNQNKWTKVPGWMDQEHEAPVNMIPSTVVIFLFQSLDMASTKRKLHADVPSIQVAELLYT